MQPKSIFTKTGTALFLMLFSAVMIYSCKKNLSQTEHDSSKITDVKTWYESTYHTAKAGILKNMSTAGAVTNGDFSQIIKPDWNNASTYNRLGSDVVELPLDDAVKLGFTLQNTTAGEFNFNKNLSHTSFVILHNTSGYKAYLMTIIADSAYVKGDYNKLSALSYKSLGDGFSGYLFYFLPNGKLVNGFKYTGGRIVKAISSTANTGLQVQNADKLKTNTECNTVSFLVYTGTICAGEGAQERCTYHYDRYTITVCSTEPRLDGDGGAPNPQGGGGGEGGGGDPEVTVIPEEIPVKDIIDSLRDTCLKKTLNKILLTQNINNTIGNLINKIFNSSAKVNLTFAENNTLPNGRLGTTPVPAISNITAAGDTIFDIKVYLNPNVLPGASKELTAVTMLHEALHAYFEYYGKYPGDALTQHAIIAAKYVDFLRVSLQSVFPNLIDADANSLILYELKDLVTPGSTTFTALASKYNLTPITVVNTGDLYKSGSKGTNGCTP